MRSLSAVALLIAAGALGACYDKGPKPELQSRPPATGGWMRRLPALKCRRPNHRQQLLELAHQVSLSSSQ